MPISFFLVALCLALLVETIVGIVIVVFFVSTLVAWNTGGGFSLTGGMYVDFLFSLVAERDAVTDLPNLLELLKDYAVDLLTLALSLAYLNFSIEIPLSYVYMLSISSTLFIIIGFLKSR